MKILRNSIILISFLLGTTKIFACTIISAKDKKGQVWTGNNEDYFFTFKNLINIVPSTNDSYGYVYFTYNDPQAGMQGGVNEAGLFFDFNWVPYTRNSVNHDKDLYPGGELKMFEYIMQHLTTVQEVVDLYKKYKVPGIEYSQLHLADKYGNLGIIVADSMWITKDNYLASTNYNLCHADDPEDPCFRMPIVQRMIKNNEPSFELFTKICDSTSQFYSSGVGTIYSNIHNLSTGEIWFYFGQDYKNAHKTSVKDLLEKGNTSIYVCDLFSDNILVRAYREAGKKAPEKAIELMESITDSTFQLTSMRLFVTALIDMEADFDSYPIFEHFLKQIKPEEKDYKLNAFALYCRGQKESAIESLDEGIRNYPNDKSIVSLKNKLNGKFPSNNYYRLELNDFHDATYVLIDNSFQQIENFLVKVGDKWVGEFPLSPDEYFFRFTVDGKVVTSTQFDVSNYNDTPHNRIVIKKNLWRDFTSFVFRYNPKVR